MQYFHVIHVERSSYMSKDTAKLATFESQKEVVCATQILNPKKERNTKLFLTHREKALSIFYYFISGVIASNNL